MGILRFVMNMESANSHLVQRKTHDLDQRARVHLDDLVLNRHLVDLDRILDQEAGAMTVTEVLNSLLMALAMNVRRNTIVLILRFVMNMESANSHLDLRKTRDLDPVVRVEVEVIAHPDDLDPSRHLADLVLIAMTATDLRRKW